MYLHLMGSENDTFQVLCSVITRNERNMYFVARDSRGWLEEVVIFGKSVSKTDTRFFCCFISLSLKAFQVESPMKGSFCRSSAIGLLGAMHQTV